MNPKFLLSRSDAAFAPAVKLPAGVFFEFGRFAHSTECAPAIRDCFVTHFQLEQI
jgi:hypothetical protein